MIRSAETMIATARTTRAPSDVVVVGGGPAGSHTALRLLARGARVTLLDKQFFPRQKPCGEFLAPECLPLLDELGLGAHARAVGARIESLRLFGYGHTTRADFTAFHRHAKGPDHGLAVRRELLDEHALDLVRSAGGDVREGWSVSGLLRGPNSRSPCIGVRGRRPDGSPFELRAGLVVGADGLRGRIAREIGRFERTRWLDHMALWARVRTKALGSSAGVYFAPGAFLAIAPVGDGWATLNAVVDRDRVRSAQDVQRLVRERIDGSAGLSALIHPLPEGAQVRSVGPLAFKAANATAPGVALVGDACGYVDPMTGEGLYFAMRGAELLASAWTPVVEGRAAPESGLAAYARARHEFAHRRFVALALQRVLRRPQLARRMLGLLQTRPGLAQLVAGMTGRAIAPGALLRPSLWREVAAAGRDARSDASR